MKRTTFEQGTAQQVVERRKLGHQLVKTFEWANPHAYLHLDVVNAEGKLEEWIVEIHSPAIMLRRGYTKDYFKPGEKITVVGGATKDGTHMMRLLRGSKSDGTKFYGDDFHRVQPALPRLSRGLGAWKAHSECVVRVKKENL